MLVVLFDMMVRWRMEEGDWKGSREMMGLDVECRQEMGVIWIIRSETKGN